MKYLLLAVLMGCSFKVSKLERGFIMLWKGENSCYFYCLDIKTNKGFYSNNCFDHKTAVRDTFYRPFLK